MTSPEQPIFIQEFDQETNLLKACVSSVVYRLKKDLADYAYAACRWLVKETIKDQTPGELAIAVKRAQKQLWYSVYRMKYLKPKWYKFRFGKDEGYSFVKVKGKRMHLPDQRIHYFWAVIDLPYQLHFIEAQLEEECTRRDLQIDALHMHRYESAASGLKYPYVWDYVWGTWPRPKIDHIRFILAAKTSSKTIVGPK